MTDRVNVRELAVETLLAIRKENRQSHLLIRDVLDQYAWLPDRERAFYVRLTEGTLERRLQLDYIINTYSKTKTGKMKPMILEILRVAVYQLRYMDSVPDSAAVNEAVRLASKRGFAGLRGFVNGVLRSIVREPEKVKFPDRSSGAAYLEAVYSMPDFLGQRWIDDYGMDRAETICRAFLEKNHITVRIRGEEEPVLEELREAGVSVTKNPLAEHAYDLEGSGDLSRLTCFSEGKLLVQDASSQLSVRAAGIKEGDRILDLCAAPGGKTMLAADLTGPFGHVLSRDLTEYKTEKIRENVERLGLSNVEVQEYDATIPDASLVGAMDVVIADVPCSGYGVIGKKPDIKYRADAENQQSLVELQRRILANAMTYVKPGGVLLFSTCTIGREENEDNVDRILSGGGFTLEESRQLLPGEDPCDGFFYARLRKKTEEE
uniref:16S rRNA (cytosine(967)-C(5))-methyltransferase RsmB n=1 Tax=Eubacterium cellulosolvens TaxID=29322 RepID=UPI00047FAB0F|nr:16S rRNA (cytosine(967)-C(5))-methyltransferase RsmB [[Eubacterium] cellulosolvens]